MPAMTTPNLDTATIPGLAPAASPTGRHQRTSRSDQQQVLSIRDVVPHEDAQRFIADSLHDIRAFMQDHHIAAAGPPFSICRPRGDNLDIETGWPTTTKPPTGTNRIHGGSLPGTLTGRSQPDRT